MVKDFTKSAGSGKAAVRQTRGPGMNRGLKKKPRPKKPVPFRSPTAKKGGTSKKSKVKGGLGPNLLGGSF